jgi:DNA-binding HxlR family transcriptional regulator
MSRRSYHQYCATAKTLDLLGERWTLLIVRELLTGPKRYADLLERLPGIGTTLLAARLKHLDQAGVVERTVLPSPARAGAYGLTRAGRELEPAILALARWGLRWTLGQPVPDDVFRPDWAVLAMQAVFDSDAARGVEETYELRVDGDVLYARVHEGAVEAVQGAAQAPDLTLTTDADTLLEIAAGRLTFAQAARQKRLAVDGDPEALTRFSLIFPRPAAPAA